MTDRKRIGVFVVTIDSYVEDYIWTGIEREARQHGYDVIYFNGSSLDGPSTSLTHLNVIYDLVNTQKLDGLIVYSSLMANYSGKDVLHNFLKDFKDIPIVSIGIHFDDYHSITLDNHESMQSITDHIISHGHTKIGYLSGPVTNIEALERLEGYKASLKNHSIEFCENWVYFGDFSKPSGIKGVEELLTNRQLKLDAIICANDDMAFGAYEAIYQKGLHVGQDIAVTGFDNIVSGETIFPPLTTVDQPHTKMGQKAIEFLYNIYNGKIEPQKPLMEGEIVIRQSCGCLHLYPKIIGQGKEITIMPYNNPLTRSSRISIWFDLHGEEIYMTMYKSLPHVSSNIDYIKVLEELILAFMEDLKANHIEGRFLHLLNEYVSKDIAHIDDWQDAVFACYRYVLEHEISSDLFMLINKIFYLSGSLIGQIAKRAEQSVAMLIRDTFFTTSRIVQRFHQVMDEEVLSLELKRQIDEQAIGSLVICKLEAPVALIKGQRVLYSEMSEVIFGWDNGKVLDIKSFPTSQMLPSSLLNNDQPNQYALYPLVFQNKLFGYLIIDGTNASNLIIRSLKTQIENALEKIYWYKQIESYNKQLMYLSQMDVMTGLNNRHGFFELINHQFLHAKKDGLDLEVTYCDMDGLKQINDKYGHQEGDKAIQLISNTLKNVFRDSNNIARLGGDEFVIIRLLKPRSIVAEKLVPEVDTKLENFCISLKLPYKLSISFGIARLSDGPAISIEDLMHLADQRLYKNKKQKEKKR